ncbi:MAG: hypothetical protein ACFE85_14515 [Candidatus Hodarchaeota archaeon]
MEIEKTRETSWKIQLKKENENIELTSVEISGDVRIIKLALLKENDSIMVEMNKEEFFNFLSLISAFKDVVIGEELSKFEIEGINDNNQDFGNINTDLEEIYSINPESPEENYEDKEEEELNPEEWDPW